MNKSCVRDGDWGQMLPLSPYSSPSRHPTNHGQKISYKSSAPPFQGSFGCTVVGYDWLIVSKGNSWSIIAFIVLPNDLRRFWHLCGESLYSPCSLWSSDFPFRKRSVKSFVTQPCSSGCRLCHNKAKPNFRIVFRNSQTTLKFGNELESPFIY